MSTSTPAAPLTEGPPVLTVHSGVATITLQRPSQRNSLHDEDLHCLLRYFAQVEADLSVRVLVLTASTQGQARPVFCAGYHLQGFNAATHDPLLFEKIPDALERLRPITLCALNGSVYGGATDIAMACDLRLGLEGAEFRMPAAALGLHYYPSGLKRYVARLGLNLTQRAFLTAKAIPFADLCNAGFFESALLPSPDWDAAVKALAHHLTTLAPLAAQATKQSLLDMAYPPADIAVLRSREKMTAESRDFQEGRAAFAARRTPRFTGQ